MKLENKPLYEEAVYPSRFDIVKAQIDNKLKNKTISGNCYYSEGFHPPAAVAPPIPFENASNIILNDRFSTTSTDELLSNKKSTTDTKDFQEDDNVYAITCNEAINYTYM